MCVHNLAIRCVMIKHISSRLTPHVECNQVENGQATSNICDIEYFNLKLQGYMYDTSLWAYPY